MKPTATYQTELCFIQRGRFLIPTIGVTKNKLDGIPDFACVFRSRRQRSRPYRNVTRVVDLGGP